MAYCPLRVGKSLAVKARRWEAIISLRESQQATDHNADSGSSKGEGSSPPTKPATGQPARSLDGLVHIPPSAPARQRARAGDASNRGSSGRLHALRWLRLGALALVVIVVLFQVAQTRPAQQAWLALETGPLGSFLLPTPTPKPTAKPTRPSAPLPPGSAQVVSIIQSVFGSYADAAIAVARCESSLNPSAVNPTPIGGSHATGLFQILYPSTWRTTAQANHSPYDAQANTQAAYQIFKRDGYSWREWACKP